MSDFLLFLAWFWGWAAVYVGTPLAIAYQISKRLDPGRVLFATAVDFLKGDTAPWTSYRSDFLPFRPHKCSLASPRLVIDYKLFTASVNGVDCGLAWGFKVAWMARRMADTKERAERLNAISDSLERLGDENVIPMRKKAK